MKNILSVFTCLCIILSTLPSVFATNNNVEIANFEELNEYVIQINNGASIDAKLMGNIEITNFTQIAPNEVSSFNSTFDGNGFSITYNAGGITGLFGNVGSGGTIKNLTIKGMASGDNVAALVYKNAGTIENVTNRSTINGSAAASGIAHENTGLVVNCANQGLLSTQIGKAAGVAITNNGTIINCENTGEIRGNAFGAQETWSVSSAGIAVTNNKTVESSNNVAKIGGGANVGGIVSNNAGIITDCENTGEITAQVNYAAGIAAQSSGSVTNSQNSGDINAHVDYVGGIVGFASAGTNSKISNCKNAGKIKGSIRVGGIAGRANALIENCTNEGIIDGMHEVYMGIRTSQYFGGISGVSVADISSCVNKGAINGGYIYTGGIVGLLGDGKTMSDCTNYGNIAGYAYRVGGVAGEIGTSGGSGAKAIRCADVGTVRGSVGINANYVGSIAAVNNGDISDCYSTATLTGFGVGGLVAGHLGTSTINDCFTLSDPNQVGSSSSVLRTANVYTTANVTGGIQKPIEQFKDATIVGLLNTKNNTVSDRDIFIQGINNPIFKNEATRGASNLPDFKTTLPSVNVGGAVNVVIPKEENPVLKSDIYPLVITPNINFLLPADMDLTKVVYYTIDKDDNKLERFQKDFTQSETISITLDTGIYNVAYTKSTLPTMYVNIDENYITKDEMNTSLYHDIYSYGDFILTVPEELANQKGWLTEYASKNDNNITDPGSMKIRGRGNSSWSIDPNRKRGYQMKSEKRVDMLGMGSAKRWLLVGNDINLYKNKFGLDMAKEMGIKYAVDSEFVDLYLNGAYKGVYMFSEKVEVDKARINITDIDDEYEANNNSVDGVDLTGGYLIEVDNAPDVGFFISSQGNSISVKSPEDIDSSVAANNNYSYIYQLTTDLFDDIYGDGDNFMDKIDVESFVKYFWHQEFIRNTDCGKGSTFLYKDKDSVDPLIYAGPTWDSDSVSFEWAPYSWLLPTLLNSTGYPTLYNSMIKHKEFISYVEWYYKYDETIKNAFQKAPLIIQSYTDTLSVAGQMNSLRWNNNAPFDISNAVDNIGMRALWIDENYEALKEQAAKGEFIELPPPSDTPDPTDTSIASFSYSGGAPGVVFDTSLGDSTNGYKLTGGANKERARLFGSVNGTTHSTFRWTNDQYSKGAETATVPRIAASSGTDEWQDYLSSPSYIELRVPTIGHQNLVFSAKLGGTKKGPQDFKLSYSVDGITYTDLATYSIPTGQNKILHPAFTEVRLPSLANNKEMLYIRITTTSNNTVSGSLLSVDPRGGELAFGDIALDVKEPELNEKIAKFNITSPTNFMDKAYATDGYYKTAAISASLDGVTPFIPLFDDIRGLAISPDDGEKWQNGTFWQIETSTAGYKDLTISADAYSSAKGPAKFDLEYSTDGVSFAKIDTLISPIGEMSSLVNEYAMPTTLNNQENVYIRFTVRENIRVDGLGELFDNESKGNAYINNVLIGATPMENALPMPYNNTFINRYSSEKIPYTFLEGANAKYTVQNLQGVNLTENVAYNDGVDLSTYIVPVKVLVWVEKDGKLSISNERIYYPKGKLISQFTVSSESMFSPDKTTVFANNDNGEISVYPNGADKLEFNYHANYGIRASATTSNSWSSSTDGNKDGYWLINLNTKGYNSISFSADMTASSKGARDFRLEYSVDNITFYPLANSGVRLSPSLKQVYVDLPLPKETNNKENVWIKIILNGGENVAGYELDDAKESIGKGHTGINNIKIHGKENAVITSIYKNNKLVKVFFSENPDFTGFIYDTKKEFYWDSIENMMPIE
ncbi:MAG: CotH kinase family protein [Firmicutes bacterium]|nr:CotH kinase family protein [Bacillota bacterium]